MRHVFDDGKGCCNAAVPASPFAELCQSTVPVSISLSSCVSVCLSGHYTSRSFLTVNAWPSLLTLFYDPR